MCLIISSQTGKVTDEEVLWDSFVSNPDGWGIAWFNGASIEVAKGMKYSKLRNAYKKVEGYPYVLHLRFATHGKVNRANTHPFKLINGAWLAHNGVINIDRTNDEYSDTWHFCRAIDTFIEIEPTWFSSDEFIKDCEQYVGSHNKLVIIDKTGKIRIANKRMGTTFDEMWFSNDYSFPYWYGPKWLRDWKKTWRMDELGVRKESVKPALTVEIDKQELDLSLRRALDARDKLDPWEWHPITESSD